MSSVRRQAGRAKHPVDGSEQGCRKMGLALMAIAIPLSLLSLFAGRWYLGEEFSWRMGLDDWATFIALLALVVTYVGQAIGGLGLVMLRKWSTISLAVAFFAFVIGGLVSCGHFVVEEELTLILPYAIAGAAAFGGFNLAIKTNIEVARKQRRRRSRGRQ